MITQLRTSQKFSQKQNRFHKTPHQWKNSLEYGGKLSQCRGEKVYNSGEPDLQMARAPLEDELRNREGEKCPRRNQTALNLSLEMKGVHTFLPESTSKEEDTRLSPRKCPLTALKIKERVTFKETQQHKPFLGILILDLSDRHKPSEIKAETSGILHPEKLSLQSPVTEGPKCVQRPKASFVAHTPY